MACLITLKQEIRTLESIFPKTNNRFQILNASVDEINCRFLGSSGKKYDIHANITVSSEVSSRILFLSESDTRGAGPKQRDFSQTEVSGFSRSPLLWCPQSFLKVGYELDFELEQSVVVTAYKM